MQTRPHPHNENCRKSAIGACHPVETGSELPRMNSMEKQFAVTRGASRKQFPNSCGSPLDIRRLRLDLPLSSRSATAPLLFRSLALILLFATAFHAVAALPIPFHQVFGAVPLDAAWKVDVSGSNQVSVAQGTLKIEAAINTYAHISRPLEVDLVRAACTLRPKGGISWVCSFFLYWDARNWCQV